MNGNFFASLATNVQQDLPAPHMAYQPTEKTLSALVPYTHSIHQSLAIISRPSLGALHPHKHQPQQFHVIRNDHQSSPTSSSPPASPFQNNQLIPNPPTLSHPSQKPPSTLLPTPSKHPSRPQTNHLTTLSPKSYPPTSATPLTSP